MFPKESDILILEPGLELPSLPELFDQGRIIRRATSVATGELLCWEAPNGTPYLIKSFARKSWFSRFFFGKSSIDREWKMLNILKERGVRHAPRPVAKIGRQTILMEFIPGEKLESLHHYQHRNQLPPPKELYLALKEILCELHEVGVAHGDFRRANIMVQPDNIPRIIDWATARVSKNPKAFLYRQLLSSDNYSLVKILLDAYPETLTPQEREDAKPGPLLRFARFLRQKLYRHFIKPLRKKSTHSSSE